MRFSDVRHDPVRLSIYLVGGVFLVTVLQVLVFSWHDRANLNLVDLINNAGGACALLVFSFVAQSIPAFIGCATVWKFGRTSTRWGTPDYVLAVVPWMFWALLTTLAPRDKTLANFAIEGTVIGIAAPLGAIVRLALSRALSLGWSRTISYGAALTVALGLWRLVPWLPE
jgi:hypothetical protein